MKLTSGHNRAGNSNASGVPASAPLLFGGYAFTVLLMCAVFVSIGSSLDYVALFAVSAFLLAVLVFLTQKVSIYAGSVLLVSFAKIFFISQVISVFILHRPDASLLVPSKTMAAIVFAMFGGILGLAVFWVISVLSPVRAPILDNLNSSRLLRRLGYISAWIGLISLLISNINFAFLSKAEITSGNSGIGFSIFIYLAPLSILAISSYAAAALIDSKGRVLFTREVLTVLIIYFVLVFPIATKAEPLKPLVALALVAIAFRWRPKLMPIVVSVAVISTVSVVLYPVITISRLEAYETGRLTASVFAENLGNILSDSELLFNDIEFTRRYENELGNNYYGTPTGFADRFTPAITDRIVATSQDVHLGGWTIFTNAIVGLLPQTLGFSRDTTSRQIAVESRLSLGAIANDVGWSNSGFVADAYLAGGYTVVVGVFFVYSLLSSAVAELTFGSIFRSVIWIPYFTTFMFVPADTTFERMAPTFFWNWIVLTTGLVIAIQYIKKPRTVRTAATSRWTNKGARTPNAVNSLYR